MTINSAQKNKLNTICLSMKSTKFGEIWPEEYNTFPKLWGFFNRIYVTLFDDGPEWQKIARFSLSEDFPSIWENLDINVGERLQELAKQPCIGNGLDDYKPSKHVRIAFRTLRYFYDIKLDDVCPHDKCRQRNRRGIETCDKYRWPNKPDEIEHLKDVIYTPLGATLTIIYQIRNNLFHGSKQEYLGNAYERNKLLVAISTDIMYALLEEIAKIISPIA